MRIGIDASRAFIKNRTGIEEYSYQVIKHLRDKLGDNQARLHRYAKHCGQVVLYIRKNQKIDFTLPENWKVKKIIFPRLWTQIGLSLEMLFHPVDTLFIPAHTVPIIHPKDTMVTIHGLEYEFCPKAYSFWEKLYMRWSIKNSCKWAKTIIAVSENTKKDLMKLYNVPEDKIQVIYEGYNRNFEFPISNFESPSSRAELAKGQAISNDQITKPYLLFIGRLEERKNIVGILDAYKILVEKYNIPHSLVLAGAPGFSYEAIKAKIQSRVLGTKFKIIETGYISEAQKWQLLSKADIFLFPSLYEGFGIPILEAQSVGVPVVTSNISSIPEVVGDSAVLIDPKNSVEISEAVQKILADENLKKDLIAKGLENVKRFSWSKCTQEIAEVLYA